MPKNMSFSITTSQMYQGAKVVTRRLGWNNLKVGDVICAVEKGMGLKKGEKVKKIGLIEIISVVREPLSRVTYIECVREGFPEMTPAEFITMFCRANKCTPDTLVNRIAFLRRYEAQHHMTRSESEFFFIEKATSESDVCSCREFRPWPANDPPIQVGICYQCRKPRLR